MIDQLNASLGSEDILFPSKITLQSKGKLLLLDEPWVMGILNITPDSFYKGSRLGVDPETVNSRAREMLQEGAAILDVGGYSSRPRAEHIPLMEELKRTIPIIERLKIEFPESLISIDTFRAKVAEEAVDAGADMVNDISAGELDADMLKTVSRLSVPYIAMHMKGNPQNMQTQNKYKNIILEIAKYFSRKLNECAKAGINDVVLDPGFGFSKTIAQNYWILKNLSYFKSIQAPVLVGISRKSMIYKTWEGSPDDALNGTTALNMTALLKGANILRVHDVKEAVETVKLYKQLYP
jgi:dihydropteroate synthase